MEVEREEGKNEVEVREAERRTEEWVREQVRVRENEKQKEWKQLIR